MPGILPMKVIKVGTSAQSRIAQACDRCRSKKIRCDGTRPTCSQCANVGFECRTSDKLSRRAFPRGYTESLEERVRALETEVRELKDLLDEKDEKIDLLSRMHGNRQGSCQDKSHPQAPNASPKSPMDMKSPAQPKEDTFRVQASPLLLGVEDSDSFFMGPSSGRTFVEAFKRKIQETGKSCNDFNPEAFLHIQGSQPLIRGEPCHTMRVPPRLFSDRCVNVYFQEWAPLFPILHKPTFLRSYEDFVADPEKVRCTYKLTQLYLVFSIAGLSSDNPDLPQLAACERQWTKALDSIIMDNTMNTLQCLVLAILYCSIRADFRRLLHYKALAVALSHRLGLHHSQKRFSFGALTTETRKKVFWTLYTLDCFTAATLGLPKLLKEDDVQVEYPSDTDDDYVTEKGFQPTLPGESTRISSALALFRATRILAQVLETNYPTATSYDLSLQQMATLETELNGWYYNLPKHLRLTFKQDKPSTDVTGSRSPLLALVYYYIRTLIYRPAVGSSLGAKAAPAVLAIGDASKHMIQIVELLDERNMSFSFCLNKADLLTLSGMSLLYQTLELKQDGKLMREDERLVNAVLKMLCGGRAPGSTAFIKVARLLINVELEETAPNPAHTEVGSSPSVTRHDMKVRKKSWSKGNRLNPMASASESDLLQQQEKLRRMTMPNITAQRPDFYRAAPSRQSFESLPDDIAEMQKRRQEAQRANLDFLNLNSNGTPGRSQTSSPVQHRQRKSHTPLPSENPANSGLPIKLSAVSEWEALLGSMDGGINNVYDAIYGGPPLVEAIPPASTATDWSPDSWDLANFNLGSATGAGGDFGAAGPGAPQSVLSLSDESLSSGEEIAPSELGLSVNSAEYNHMLAGVGNEGYRMDSFESFNL
ncbi:fungal specific transcription factor domain-containing protein [Sarocladium implicatum]|nr:fungal specific transcription factor domain-containing protein [Sarocladium implicatum]